MKSKSSSQQTTTNTTNINNIIETDGIEKAINAGNMMFSKVSQSSIDGLKKLDMTLKSLVQSNAEETRAELIKDSKSNAQISEGLKVVSVATGALLGYYFTNKKKGKK